MSFFNVALNNGFFYTLTVWLCDHMNEKINILNKGYELSDIKWFVYYGYGIILTLPTFFVLRKIIYIIDNINRTTALKKVRFLTTTSHWLLTYYISLSVVFFIFKVIDDSLSIEELAHYGYKYTHENLGWYTSELYDFDPFFADLIGFTFIVFPIIFCYFTSKSIKKHMMNGIDTN